MPESVSDVKNAMNSSFSIEHVKIDSAKSMSEHHFHNKYEIYYLLNGERYYFIKDRSFHVKKGDLVLIDMYELHKTTNCKNFNYDRILINFDDNFIDSFLSHMSDIDLLGIFKQNVSILRLNKNQQAFIENLLLSMLRESDLKNAVFEGYLKIKLLELLININRYYSELSSPKLKHPTQLHEKVSEVTQYINANYNQNITLKSVSERFFISQYYLCRAFKEITGFSFTEYVNTVRIKEAQTLLRESSFNVSQITEKVGYQSITHFGRIFKNVAGISPLKYKKASK